MIRKLFTPPVFDDEEQDRVARLLNVVLVTMLLATVFGSLAVMIVEPGEAVFNLVFGAILLGLILFARRWMRKGQLRRASGWVTALLWLVFTIIMFMEPTIDYAILTGYFLTIAVAALLIGAPAATVVGVLSGIVTLVAYMISPTGVIDLVTVLMTLVLTTLLLNFAVRSIEEGFVRAQTTEASLLQSNRALEIARSRLEERVAERTDELARRARYLEATTEVAREAASELDMHEVLSRVVNLISERFNFYHAGIFLLDASGQWAVLQAASSEGGQRMLARGHRLAVGQTGTVGYVTRYGETRIAFDAGSDAVFFDNPDLPETRSVMTLPLRARGEIIGALDMQSDEQRAFSEEDAVVLQALADLVAMAIDNAQLFSRLEESVEAEMRAYGEVTQEAWSDVLRAYANRGYHSGVHGTRAVNYVSPEQRAPLDAENVARLRPEMLRAHQTGRAIFAEEAVAIPIKLRDTVLGVMRLCKPEGSGSWSDEQVSVVQKLTDELGIALENARLYQNSLSLAARQQKIGDVTTSMRQSLDMDTVLRTAVQQIREALGLRDLMVHLGSTPADYADAPADDADAPDTPDTGA